jgi:hypothetical protein
MIRPSSADPPGTARIDLGVPVGARTQLDGDLARGARPHSQPVGDVVDRDAKGIPARSVCAARYCSVEPQAAQVIPDRGVDDSSRGIVLSRGIEHPGDVDTNSVTFSHAHFDAGATRLVPQSF